MRGIRVFGQNAFRSIGQSGGASSYADKVKAIFGSSLIDYRRLNEGSGTSALDSSPKAHAAGTISGATWTPGAGFDGGAALLYDGVNDYTDIYSPALNTDFNGQELTIGLWLRMSGAGVWTDVATRYAVRLNVDGPNNIYIAKIATNNTLEIAYRAGGVTKFVDITTSLTTWMHLALTASKTADQAKVYINGVQSGSTQTGLGTWAGALLSTACVIGAQTNSGTSSTSGYIRDCAIGNAALTPAQIAQLAVQ